MTTAKHKPCSNISGKRESALINKTYSTRTAMLEMTNRDINQNYNTKMFRLSYKIKFYILKISTDL